MLCTLPLVVKIHKAQRFLDFRLSRYSRLDLPGRLIFREESLRPGVSQDVFHFASAGRFGSSRTTRSGISA
jgi:hypothetical protein